jgi:hypothetical protein
MEVFCIFNHYTDFLLTLFGDVINLSGNAAMPGRRLHRSKGSSCVYPLPAARAA